VSALLILAPNLGRTDQKRTTNLLYELTESTG